MKATTVVTSIGLATLIAATSYAAACKHYKQVGGATMTLAGQHVPDASAGVHFTTAQCCNQLAGVDHSAKHTCGKAVQQPDGSWRMMTPINSYEGVTEGKECNCKPNGTNGECMSSSTTLDDWGLVSCSCTSSRP